MGRLGGLLGGTNTYSQSSLYSAMSLGTQGVLLGGGFGNGLEACIKGGLGSSLRGGLGSGGHKIYSGGIWCAQNLHNKLDGLIVRKLGKTFLINAKKN